jgi:hypothetical protein
MSIKIYEAYKIPQDDIKRFSDDVFNQFRKQTIERVQDIIDSFDFAKYVNKLEDKESEQSSAVYDFWRYLLNEIFLPASESIEKNFFNLDYGLWVYPYQDSFLIIPNKPQWLFYDLLNMSVDSEVFSYWNNRDMPDNVKDGEWKKRSDVWDYVLDNSVCLYLEGFKTKDDFYSLMFEVNNSYQTKG